MSDRTTGILTIALQLAAFALGSLAALMVFGGCSMPSHDYVTGGAGRGDSHVAECQVGYEREWQNGNRLGVYYRPRIEIDDPSDGLFPNKSPRAGDNADPYAFFIGGRVRVRGESTRPTVPTASSSTARPSASTSPPPV